MLCFVMALKARAASSDGDVVERMFEQTLTSVCRQTDADFRVIVVCNEIPRTTAPVSDRVQFLVRDLPIPDRDARDATMVDKWTKLQHGLVLAGALKPDFVMLMDADDLVSRRLAAFANAHTSSNGWIFGQGYQWKHGSRWFEYTDRFNCGTNAIVSSRLIRFPRDASASSRNECVILANGHTVIDRALRDQGTPLEALPFPGAVWVVGHGDNWTSLQAGDDTGSRVPLRFWLGSIRRQRLLTGSLKREFGLL